MSTIPRDNLGKIVFCENHVDPWTTNSVAMGSSAADITAWTAKTTAARAAYDAQQAAQQVAKDATTSFNVALDVLMTATASVIKQVRAKAGISGNDIYALASLPVPATPSPHPAPTTRPVLDIASVIGRTTKISIHGGTSSRRTAKPNGVAAAYIYAFVGTSYPSDPTAWQFIGAATKNTFDVVFPDSVPAGAQVWITGAWVGTRGETGPACSPITTNIQGGGMSESGGMQVAA